MLKASFFVVDLVDAAKGWTFMAEIVALRNYVIGS
jgi:hypothetical protein